MIVQLNSQAAPARMHQKALLMGVPEAVARLIVYQSCHETGAWTSALFREANNAFGYKQYPGSEWQLPDPGPKSPEGDHYAAYHDIEHSTGEIVAWWERRQRDHRFTWQEIQTPLDYVHMLKACGYFGDTVQHYLAGVQRAAATIQFVS